MKNKPYMLYEVPKIENLVELVDVCAHKYGDMVAFQYLLDNKEVNVSYNQFKSEVNDLGKYIHSLGLKGKKIAVIGENSYEWILAYFAVVNSGNVIVPIDKGMPIEEIMPLLLHSDSKVLFYSSTYADIGEKAKKSNVKCICMNTIVDLINLGKQHNLTVGNDFVNNKIDNNKLCAIFYTSGTTGKPKGVMLSHKNLASNAFEVSEMVYDNDTTMLLLPLHHTFGFTAGVTAIMLQGIKIFICKNLRRVAEDIKKVKPTHFSAVPVIVEAIYRNIWNTAKKQNKEEKLKKAIKISNFLLKFNIDLRRIIFKEIIDSLGGKLKFIICGGAPSSQQCIDGLESFGIHYINGYGMTECSPILAVNRNEHYNLKSVGQKLSSCNLKVDNPDSDGKGEILVSGDMVMLGYYKDNEETEKAFDGRWLKTGDLGFIDDEGFLYLTGRKKNLIILSNGENVSAEELEMHLLSIPYVKEAICSAKNNSIHAEMFLDTDKNRNAKENINLEIKKLNEKLPLYKNIKTFELRDKEFLKNRTFKIIRNYEENKSDKKIS